MIENIWELCAEEETVRELPYWETINRYLETDGAIDYTDFKIAITK